MREGRSEGRRRGGREGGVEEGRGERKGRREEGREKGRVRKRERGRKREREREREREEERGREREREKWPLIEIATDASAGSIREQTGRIAVFCRRLLPSPPSAVQTQNRLFPELPALLKGRESRLVLLTGMIWMT